MCDRKLSAKVKSKMYPSVYWTNHALWNGNCGDDRKADGKNESDRVENGEMSIIGNYKIGQDKERVCERDGKNCKAGIQTSGTRLPWYEHVKRREENYVGMDT